MKIAIIGGFLGSGKTTLIKELGKIYSENGKTVAYLTNEIGEEVIDGDLLRYNVKTKEMTTACITCNLKENITVAVEQFITQVKPDILFIESKENVSPLVVKEELKKSSLKSGKEEYEFTPLMTVINGATFFKDVKKKKRITFDQILVSEIIILNKIDLIPGKEADLIQESIHQINKNAKIMKKANRNEKEMEEIIQLLEEEE